MLLCCVEIRVQRGAELSNHLNSTSETKKVSIEYLDLWLLLDIVTPSLYIVTRCISVFVASN